jgi:hypothetical protein
VVKALLLIGLRVLSRLAAIKIYLASPGQTGTKEDKEGSQINTDEK